MQVKKQMTKVFKSGNSMAVRLPKGFQPRGSEVEIRKIGNEICIRDIPRNLAGAFELFGQLPADFFPEGRVDTLPQEREHF